MGFRKGTGFTNINRILQANRGSKLGGAVAGGITGQAQKVKTGIQGAQQGFEEQSQQTRLDTDAAKQKREQILGRFDVPKPTGQQAAPVTPGAPGVTPPAGQPVQPIASQEGVSQKPGNEISTPPPFGAPGNETKQPGGELPPVAPAAFQAPTEQEISDFTKYRTGTYTGPSELQDLGALTSQAQQAESLGGLARSAGGRQELLRQFVGGRDYTSGQRKLDETLLSQDDSGLGAAARQTRGAVGQLEEANRLASDKATEYRNRAKLFGEETQGLIGEKKAPISTSLDERMKQAQEKETTRLANLKSIQDQLTGQGDYAGLDKMAQLGLGLQDAADMGYIGQNEIANLLGDEGLLARGSAMGLDVNSLINERIKNNAAQNLTRTGIASDEDVARMNALDRLAGKQGTDLEFREGRNKYGEGSTGFDLNSLNDFITRAERQKAGNDQATLDKIEARNARYMNQAIAGGKQEYDAALKTGGGLVEAAFTPGSYYNPGQIGQNIKNFGTGIASGAEGGVKTADNAGNALLEGLTKLNIGGKSIADTEGGRQLLKAIELKNKIVNETTGMATKSVGQMGSGIKDMMSGNVGGALTNFYRAPNDIAGKTVHNVGKSIGDAAKKLTGGGIKISDEDLKTDIDYSPKDVQAFMDRLKPASYDYKDEVKNDPRASKDRQIGVMAQDLEKSKLGKQAVHNADVGKIVDYKDLEPKMLASLAALNQRLKKIEGKE